MAYAKQFEWANDPIRNQKIFNARLDAEFGAIAAAVLGLTFTPERFDAEGDGVTDDTAAFQAMATAVRAAGGGTIDLGINKTYLVFPSPAVGASNLLDLNGCKGVRINFNGSKIVCPATFSGGRFCVMIRLEDCYDIEVNGYYAEQTTTLAADISNGLIGVFINNENRDIRINAAYQKYGRSVVDCQRSTSARTRGISINGLTADNVYYGNSLSHNGDRTTIRGLKGINCGRVGFASNIHGLDVEVESIPGPNTAQDYDLTCNTSHLSTALENTLADVKLRYLTRAQTATCSALVVLAMQQGTATSTPGSFKNIDISIDAAIGTAGNTPCAFKLFKQDSAAGFDSTTRNHVIENVTISATLRDFVANLDDIFRWGVDGTWAGETVRNIRFQNFTSTGSGPGQFELDSTAVGACVFDNVRLAHNLTWTNDSTGVEFHSNCSFPNASSYSKLTFQGEPWVSAGQGAAPSHGSVAFALGSTISPSQITSNQDDYNPTGLSTAVVLRLSSDASRNITGIVGGFKGRLLYLHNVGSNNIVLKDETTSTAANRLALTGDLTLAPDSVCTLHYDATTSRWRALGSALVNIAGGVSGLGSGVATFLGTPSSANLAAALTDESGTGLVPFVSTGTWTPVLTFATPGNLSVAYSSQAGSYIKIGKLVTVSFILNTSSFTHTTASGDLNITGLPFTSQNVSNDRWRGPLNFGGITKAGYTSFAVGPTANTTLVVAVASGSAVAPALVQAADMPTGGSVILQGSFSYIAAS